MNRFENKLYEGSVLGKLILFSLPLLVSNIVQSLYNVADMLIVGRFSGYIAMSGVYIGGQVTFILTNIVIGLCMGGTVLISQYMSSGNRDLMQKATATMFTVLIICAAAITAGMILFREPLLRLINTPEESFRETSNYLVCTVFGTIFIFGYNALSALMRALGDSRRPFVFVCLACVTNIVLDWLFVGVFGMSAFGAALATVISQALSMILCVLYMIRNRFMFDFRPSSFRIDTSQLRLIFRIGLPTMVQNGVSSLSFLFITALANSLGAAATAAIGAVAKANSFAIMPAVAMSMSVSTMSAQSIGARKWDRAIKCCWYGAAIAFLFGAAAFAAAQFFPAEILRLFSDEEAMIAPGVIYLRLVSWDFLLVPMVFCINGMMMGAGHTMFTLFVSLTSSLILRIPVAMLLGVTMQMGVSGIGYAAPAATAGALIVQLIYLATGKWKVNAALSDRDLRRKGADGITRVSIVGMGALGILFGKALMTALPDGSVRYVMNEERRLRAEKNGVFCNGQPFRFRAVDPVTKGEEAGLVIFAVKSTGLEAAVADAANQVGENTVILSVMNGISSEERLGEAFGAEKVIYCIAQGMDATRTGNELQYVHAGKLCIGEADGGETARVRQVAALFEKAGIECEVRSDMKRQLWSKFMLNCGVNQSSMAHDVPYGGLQTEGTDARNDMIAAMREVRELSDKAGIGLTEEELSQWLVVVGKLSPEGMPSMRQDALERRKSESELFGGTVVKLAEKYGVPVPVNERLYRTILEMEEGY